MAFSPSNHEITLTFDNVVIEPGAKINQAPAGPNHQARLMDQAGHLMDELRKQRKHTTKRIDKLTTVAFGITNAVRELADSLDRVVHSIDNVTKADQEATGKVLGLANHCISTATGFEGENRLNALHDKIEARAERERAKPKAWHCVTEATPPKATPVLVKTNTGRIYLAEFRGRNYGHGLAWLDENGLWPINHVVEWAEIPA